MVDKPVILSMIWSLYYISDLIIYHSLLFMHYPSVKPIFFLLQNTSSLFPFQYLHTFSLEYSAIRSSPRLITSSHSDLSSSVTLRLHSLIAQFNITPLPISFLMIPYFSFITLILNCN